MLWVCHRASVDKNGVSEMTSVILRLDKNSVSEMTFSS
jgi:hypothetical protein